MNKFDLEFMNGYIKTSLRLARKINMAKTLDEAKRIALEIEEKAMMKLEELTSSRLDYLNSIVHGSWLDPTPEKIRGIAGDMRELLRVILGDTA